MKKLLLSLVAFACFSALATAQDKEIDITLNDGVVATDPVYSAKITGIGQWGSIGVGVGVLDFTTHKAVKVNITDIDGFQVNININKTSDWSSEYSDYIQLNEGENTIDLDAVAKKAIDGEKITAVKDIAFNLQATKAGALANVVAVAIVPRSGDDINAALTGQYNGGIVANAGTALTFNKQYANTGRADINLGDYKGYKVVFSEALPEGSTIGITGHYKASAEKWFGTGSLAGKTEGTVLFADVEFPNDVTTFDICLQMSGTNAETIKIQSITLLANDATSVESESSIAEVISVEYTSLSGVKSAEPFKGINIVKEILSDGSVRITKIVK